MKLPGRVLLLASIGGCVLLSHGLTFGETTAPKGQTAPEQRSVSTASSRRSVDQELPKLLDRVSALLAGPSESVRDYRRKKLIDLYTAPSLWVAGGVLGLILLFWRLYRRELRDLVGNLQTLKIGDSLQFVRATVEEMRSFGEGDPEFENPAQQVVGAPLENFFSFLRYPANKLANTLDDPFVSMNWPPLPWLRNLEASLSIQVERLKASPHFSEDHPPKDFIEARKRLFRALVSLGNYYGFVKRDVGGSGDRPRERIIFSQARG
jgi:hypothetical protein